MRTPELCLEAVKADGYALACVPKAMRSESLCLAAVQSDGNALEFVPKRFLTPEMCMAAVAAGGWELARPILAAVPKEFRTPELCLVAAREQADALEEIPDAVLSAEICLAAVEAGACSRTFRSASGRRLSALPP